MEKQMYLETRGTVVYLVVRANKQLNTAERRNLKQWGFILQDSALRVYALGFNRDASAAEPIIAKLRRFGFELTDNVPVCALVDGQPREVVHPADKYLRHRESGYKALRAAGIIPEPVRSFRRCGVPSKIAPQLADEESNRYGRMIATSFRMCY